MGIARDEVALGRTQCPRRGRQIPADFAPETGPRRRLARHLRFGYRRARSRLPWPWFHPRSWARSRTATGAKGGPAAFGQPLTLPTTNPPLRMHGKSNGRKPFGMNVISRNFHGPRRQDRLRPSSRHLSRTIHRRSQPRGFRRHARAEFRDAIAPGRRRHQRQGGRHRERLRHGGCGAQDRGQGATQGICHAGHSRQCPIGRRGRGLSRARRECSG